MAALKNVLFCLKSLFILIFLLFFQRRKKWSCFIDPHTLRTNTLTLGGKQERPWGQRFPADVGGTGSTIRQRRITFPFGTSQPRLWVMMVYAILKMLCRSNLIHYECQWLGMLPSRRPAITTTPKKIRFHYKAYFILLQIVKINIRA